MPELPEVEVVRAGLAPAVSGATVTAVEVYDARSLRRHDGGAEEFVHRLTGRGILAAVRRGKFLWMPLAPAAGDATVSGTGTSASAPAGDPASLGAAGAPREALVAHLGMSGQVLLRDRTADDARTRIRLELEHPALGPLRLNFVDQRIFGSMAVDALVPTSDGAPGGFGGGGVFADEAARAAATAPLVPSRVAHIARDPLDGALDERRFFFALARRRSGIKRALLDQTLVSGIGNIYADEALWAARVHFEEESAAIGRRRAGRLLVEVRAVLERALGEGGTSFDAQYVNVNGASGYFSHSLNAYGQQGRPCPRCGRPIVRVAFMNRSSHLCLHCQRRR